MRKPWERQTGESSRAYALFVLYRDIGPRRSIGRMSSSKLLSDGVPDAAQAVSVPRRSRLEVYCQRHRWVARAKAWDDHLQAIRDREAARDAAKWERRRLAAAEQVWTDGQGLRERARALTKFPLVRMRIEERDADGQPKTIVYEPVGWSLRDIAVLAKAAAELEAAALAAISQDPADLSEGELDAIRDVERAEAAP